MSRSRTLAWVAFGAIVLVLGLAAERSRFTARFRNELRRRTVLHRELPSGDAVRILTELGRFHPLPPEQRGGAPVDRRSRLSLDAMQPEELVRLLALDPTWLARDGAVLVSLLVKPEDLARLTAHSEERGKEWEVPAFVAVVEQHRALYAARVGLRLHGGWVRRYPELVSHRLYFRRRDGAPPFPRELLPGYDGPPLSRLIVRFDGDRDRFDREWHFTGPLAFDIARKIGLPAPATLPVALFLNGEFRGVRALSPHLSTRFFRDLLGHDRFVLVDTKTSESPVQHGDPALFTELNQRFRGLPRLSAEDVGREVDLDNLIRWHLTAMFCATEDRLQGPLWRDLSRPEARWSWYAWDMDQSFGRSHRPGIRWSELPLTEDFVHRGDLRNYLMSRLLEDDPAFRARFAGLFNEAMNRLLTDEFLAERTGFYLRQAEIYGLSEGAAERLRAVRLEAAARKATLARELERRFGPGLGLEVPAGR